MSSPDRGVAEPAHRHGAAVPQHDRTAERHDQRAERHDRRAEQREAMPSHHAAGLPHQQAAAAHQRTPAQHGTATRHGTADGGRHPTSWATAARATLHCLTGCAIGEVAGMAIGTALGLHDAATVALAVALAFFFGYLLTMRGVLRAGLTFRNALRVALAADTVSILVMEVLDNTVMLTVPGAMDAGLSSLLFWGALAFSLLVAFVLTLPLNRWMISRGRGHAVVHHYHGAH